MAQWLDVAKVADLPAGGRLLIDVQDRPIALFNLSGTIYAMDNTCPHRGGSLVEGEIDGTIVTCPWHGWEFDICTGQSPINPAACVRKYEVKVEGGDLFIEFEEYSSSLRNKTQDGGVPRKTKTPKTQKDTRRRCS